MQHRRNQLREAQRRYQTKRDIKLGVLERENTKLRRKLRMLYALLSEFSTEVSQLEEYKDMPRLQSLLNGARNQACQLVAQDVQHAAEESVVDILSRRSAPAPPICTTAPTRFDILEIFGLKETG
jgi:hypothetical protein